MCTSMCEPAVKPGSSPPAGWTSSKEQMSIASTFFFATLTLSSCSMSGMLPEMGELRRASRARRSSPISGSIPDMEQLLNVKVAKKKVEAIDICSFELVHPAGGELPGFTAGSHIDVHIADGLVR